ncbi:MAG TPA: hypothetical protein VGR28_06005 [Candidatus Thermoplasmatota archaeon]|nr:hypothetical protein [Candidatus Thermoplasmatota archaeon]
MELLQNGLLATSIAATLAWAAWRWPTGKPWERAAAAVLAYPTLLFAGEMLTNLLVPPLSPLPIWGMVPLALLPAALVAGAAVLLRRMARARPWLGVAPLVALAPPVLMVSAVWSNTAAPAFFPERLLVAAVGMAALIAWTVHRGVGRLRLASPAVVVPLVMLALPMGFLQVAVGLQAPEMASHVWRVEVEPSGAEAYDLRVPFLVPAGLEPWDAEAARHAMAIDRLRGALRVPEGRATLPFAEDGRALRIEGNGPATVEARVDFYGALEHREVHAALADLRLALAPGGPASIDVVWVVALAGGGHSCGTSGEVRGTVEAGTEARLAGPDLHEHATHFITACP